MKTDRININLKIWCLSSILLMSFSCSQLPISDGIESELSADLKQALAYYENRKPKQAKEIIENYLHQKNIEPGKLNAAHRLLGSIYFSTQEFGRASHHYGQAISIDPLDYTSQHRYWSSALLANDDNVTRSRIRSEIGILAKNPRITTNMLLAVYHGYGYLRKKEAAKKTLVKLIKASPSTVVDDSLPFLLMEEMLSIRSLDNAWMYAQVFMSRFINHVNFPIVITSLFNLRVDSDMLNIIVSKFLDGNQYNPYLEFQIARYELNRQQNHAGALQRLENLVHRIEAGKLILCPKDANLPICDYYLNKLIGDAFQLHANLLAQRGQLGQAIHYATLATNTIPDSAYAWADLSKYLMQGQDLQRSSRALETSLNLQPNLKLSLELFIEQNRMKATSQVQAKKLLARQQRIPYFKDVSKEFGLLDIKAGRVAWGDVNNDGYDDLLFDGSILFINKKGQGFENISQEAGLIDFTSSSGGLFIDFDNDGRLDILSTGKTALLLRNNGNTHFSTFYRFSSDQVVRIAASSWGDYNNDGYADLYLANYEKPAIERAICDYDQLFINDNGKAFDEFSLLLNKIDPYRVCSRGVLWSDLNQDGKQEIVVSSYRQHPNRLFMQTPENELLNIAYGSRFQGDLTGHSIAAVTADFNGDGRLDIYQTNLAHPRYLQFSDSSHLYLSDINNETIRFTIKNNTGIAFDETNADITSADFDNDGDMDLFITSVYPGRFSSLYLNDGKAHFKNVSWLSNTQVSNGWGVASADFDNDGDIDILIASKEGVRLLRNESVKYKSLKVIVNSEQCQRNGLGMKLWLSKKSEVLFREIQAGKGTGTQDSSSVVFGLGAYQGNMSLRTRDVCGNDSVWSIDSDQRQLTIY